MTGFLWSDDADAFFDDKPKKDSLEINAKRSGESPTKPTPSTKPKPPSKPKPGASSAAPLSVGQLNAWVKRAIDESVPMFWLAAEIGNLNQSASGHVYLTLKDATSQVSAVLWRSTFERLGMDLREGMAVLVQGRIDVYGPRGTYQIIINRMEQQGLGALQAAFRRLHAKLEQEGLFAAERKKPLPEFPTRIGFVTSPSGAAIHDFTQVLKRRWPGASVLIIPSRVQGEGAAKEIAEGIRVAAQIRPTLDVLVVGRGGGSLEDLWCFNEEVVVRAIVACPLPTISAVGHEIDVTLSDLAADVRALTPSEAAERVAPSRDEIVDVLSGIRQRIDTLMMHRISQAEMRLRSVISRPVLASPERSLETPMQRLDDLHEALDHAMDASIQTRAERLERLSGVLDAISPLKTLARGYSVTMDATTGAVISSVKQLRLGQEIQTILNDGKVVSTIKSKT
ncbi:MAG: exodeoxyribonuclease VII large subunit [Pirellula sp.]